MTYLPHQQRVVDEQTELDIKRSGLSAFFGTTTFASLPKYERKRLQNQIFYMSAYSDILDARIKAFEVSK